CDEPGSPYCDEGSRECWGCRDDDDCDDAGTPICGANHQCRGCLGGGECGGQQCDEGQCVNCLDGGDDQDPGCTAGSPHCDEFSRECWACRTNADCPNDPQRFCDGGTHACRACADGAECAGAALGQACVDGDCEECDDDGDCAGSPGGPACDDLACVACRTDGNDGATDPGCTVGEPFCNEGDPRTCRACRTDADCPEATASFCDAGTHVCRGCDTDQECDDAGLGKGCLGTGECVDCDEDADCTDGETLHGCDPRENTCSGAVAGDVSQCQPCVSDLDCSLDGSSACVVVTFGDPAVEVGTYCALQCSDPDGLPPDVYCSSNVGRGNRCLSVQTRSLQNNDLCVPATTTCEAYGRHNDNGCAGLQGFCSHDGEDGDGDGFCITNAQDVRRCTYPCTSSGDCPSPFGCGTMVPGLCNVSSN
ncbi:MAG: hypothetical protein HYY06_03795, partial [Deltaproteobacteria bacterium]|nr:hypothetical protein [Deltaproteobacteria bacterium]